MMLLAVLGTVIAWLVLAGLSPTFSIQVRESAVRSATTFLGAAFGRPVWYRKLRLPALVQQLNLESAEKRWLTRVLGEGQAVPHVELSLRVGDGRVRGHQIPMELQVQNRGKQPVRLADVEAKEKAPWTAEVNGAKADVFFTREERESLIPAGTMRTFHPRLYAPGGGRSAFDVLLRCGSAGPLARLRTEGGS
jgi:hypothetical protein